MEKPVLVIGATGVAVLVFVIVMVRKFLKKVGFI